MTDDDFLSVAEVAERLKLHPQTIRNWINDGTLAHTRVGRAVRIRRADDERLAGVGRSEASLLTVAEVAQMLRVHEQTIRNWIDRGNLAAMHVGRRARIRPQDLDAVIEAGSSGLTEVTPPSKRSTASDFWGRELVGEVSPPG
jgi:excisionase family DNA binding protein